MATTEWVQKAGQTSDTETDNVEEGVAASETEWVQKAGQSSETDVDNITTLVEQAETAEANASASETAAASSATSAASSATSASTSATSASTSASAASTSASAASASETAAGTSETNSAASASAASASATSAATSATNAATSEANASTSATAASTSATNAATSATSAETAYDNFDDRYLGDKASDPTLDNDGDALVTGALYYNTTSDTMKVYNGSAWQDVAPVATSLTVSQISDLTATATELNYSGGVTSAIQTQLDAKGTGTVSSLSDLSVTASATELNRNSVTTVGTVEASKVVTSDASNTVRFGDNGKAIFGDGSDLRIYHDGSNSYIQDAGVGNLYVKANVFRVYNAAGDEISANFVQNGAVTLYHDNSFKLATTSTGVDVTGTVTAAGATFSGDVTFSGAIDEAVYVLTGTALDPANGTIQTKTLASSVTLTDSLSEGESVTLMIDDGTDYTITWPTTTWVNNGGSVPTLATTGYTVIVLWKVSTTLYGALVGDGS